MEGEGADAGRRRRRRRDRRRRRSGDRPTRATCRPDGAQALVDAAVERFGRLDVLVNNAGIMRWAGFPTSTPTTSPAPRRARRRLVPHGPGAWPHMVEQGYGRIVMTTSTGMLGLPDNTAYATAKGGVIGLTRSLAVAGSARHQGQLHRPGGDHPDGVAGGPPGCTRARRPDGRLPRPRGVPGQRRDLHAGGGRFARLFIASTPGYVTTATEPTPRTSPSTGGDQRRDRLRRRRPRLVGPVPGPPRLMDLSLDEPERDLVDLCRDFARKEIAARARWRGRRRGAHRPAA